MVRVKIALAFLLAACFVSTQADYRECTFDNYNMCMEEFEKKQSGWTQEEVCNAKQCLARLVKNCDDVKHPDEKMKITATHDWLKGSFESCQYENEAVMTSMFHSTGHEDTTRQPWSEPNHYETTRNRWEQPHSTPTRNPWGGHDNHYRTTTHHYDHNGVCTNEQYEECTRPIHGMEHMSSEDGEEMCRIWWRAKVCYGDMHYRCPDGEVKSKIEGTWGYMESQMRYCTYYARCTEEDRHKCGEDLKEAYRMEDKCRASGKAKECLHKLADDCRDDFVKNMIYYESLPWVEKEMKDCMYGNGVGSWDESYYGSSGQTSSVFPVLSLVVSLAAAMTIGRY